MRFNDKKILMYSLILAVIVLSVIPLIRIAYFDSSFVGQESYYNQRTAQSIIEKGIPKSDMFVNRPYLPNPYHLCLAGVGALIKTVPASYLIPFILGILSAYLFFLIIKQFKLNSLKRFIIMILLIISPPFIYTFSTSNQYCLAVFMSLLAFYLFTKQKKSFFILSSAIFAVSALFGIMHSLIIISILISFSIKDKKQIIKAGAISLIMLIISFAYNFSFLLKHSLLFQQTSPEYLIGFISDLGGTTGFGIFTILLMIFGLFIVWKIKKQPLAYVLFFIAVGLSIAYLSHINIYLVFVFSIFAGLAFYRLLKMRWTLSLIKQLAVVVIIAGVLFSSISYINQTALAQPSKEIVKSLEWLKENSDNNSVVLSHYSRGIWIESLAQRRVISDYLFEKTPNFKDNLKLSQQIFYSRNLKNTTALLSKNNISYIWIDSEMKNNLVWSREKEGLLFLFRNMETFKNVYQKEGIEIWKVLK